MNVEPYTLDANVLFYAIDRLGGVKHQIAFRLVQAAATEPRCLLSVQTLAETYNAIVRKRPDAAQRARTLLGQAQQFIQTMSSSPDDFFEAIRMHESRPVQFWDMMLLATAKRHGCATILTEDRQDRPIMDGVRYLNPFEPQQAEEASRFFGTF